jgi:hypothetical protein
MRLKRHLVERAEAKINVERGPPTQKLKQILRGEIDVPGLDLFARRVRAQQGSKLAAREADGILEKQPAEFRVALSGNQPMRADCLGAEH